MITTEEKIKIKKVLGHRYGSSLEKFMIEKGYTNEKGKSYSISMIRNVMNGIPHETIEKAIFELVAIKKQEIEQRKSVLN